MTCNFRPNFTRKNSELHESQLNFELLRHLGVKTLPSIAENSAYLSSFKAPTIDLPQDISTFLGNSYTKPILCCLPEIDEVLDWKDIQNLPLQERVRFFKEKNIDTAIHVFPNKEIASLLRRAQIPHRIGTSHRVYH